MRRDGTLPYGWIADNTRWMRKSASYHSLGDMLERQTELYRRALWDNQGCRCEVWLEKDALAGVVMDVTDPWDVPLMVTVAIRHSATCTQQRRISTPTVSPP